MLLILLGDEVVVLFLWERTVQLMVIVWKIAVRRGKEKIKKFSGGDKDFAIINS